MQAVWKYSLTDIKTTIDIPFGAKVLCVQDQHSEMCIWALVDPDRKTAKRCFQIVGTGHREVPAGSEYIGTIQRMGGSLVLHVFEVEATNAG